VALSSTIPARLAYSWYDGTPRVVPIWFHWDGKQVVLGGPPDAPKVAALQAHPAVAVTIDSDTFPYQVLQLRGDAQIKLVAGVIPEYVLAAKRYLGEEQGRSWVEQIGALFPQMARSSVRPAWVDVLDFQTRFPSAVARRMRERSEVP
jgi:hypothetical protein